MKIAPHLAIGLCAAVLAAAPAHASSSAWFDADGGRFRLVTSGAPDASGKLQGVLDIELKRGWKTYWRDPGNSGVPPQIDVSASRNVAGAEFSYPAPRRHDDGYAKWAGYDHSVRLPVSFTIAAPGKPATISANVFLGVCETICVPVQATLTLDPAADPDNAGDAMLVQTALAALPGAAQQDFGATLEPAEGEHVSITVTAPGPADALDVFVAGVDGYVLGTPERHIEGGKAVFTVKLLERPDSKPTGKGLPYTLTGAAGAVEGFLPYP